MKRAFGFFALPLIISGSAGAASALDNSDNVRCEIRTLQGAQGLQIQAMALSAVDADGEYELEVTKSGGGGKSSTSQSGDFQVLGGGETLLSEVAIGGGGSVVAQLTIWSAAGDPICKAEWPEKS